MRVAGKIVVDRFGYANNRDALLVHLQPDAERTVPAD